VESFVLMRPKEWFVLLIRVFVSAVLLLAAAGKSLSPEAFFTFLARLSIQDPSLHSVIFIGTIFVELFLGLACLIGFAPHVTLKVIGILFGLFAIVMFGALAYQATGSCGCFGNFIKSELGPFAVGRNILLAFLAFYAGRQQVHRFALSNVLNRYFNDEETSSTSGNSGKSA
jgi:predicted permease